MSIEGIFRSAKASGPMESLETGTLLAGLGLEGDRYARHEGTYSAISHISKLHEGQPEPGRQLTMLSADSVEAALQERLPYSIGSLGDLRRNLVVRGLSAEQLLAAAGHVVRLGDTCRLAVHRHCVPCLYNERKNEIPGLMNAIWKEAGVSCEVLVGGTIAVGDRVTILESTSHPIDEGHQLPGYFIPPSQRTAEMVRDALARQRKVKKELEKTDPEGVARADASYATVNLKFWPREV